jgi:ATP synthase protein I
MQICSYISNDFQVCKDRLRVMHHLHAPHAGQNKARGAKDDKCLDDGQAQEIYKPLTCQEARELKEKLGAVSLEAFLLTVLMWQGVAGVAIAALAWLVSGEALTAYSAFYGAMCVVLPSALVARTVIKRLKLDVVKHSAGRLVGLFVLELVKIVMTVCLLIAAHVFLDSPQWIAIVVGFVVTLKVYWVVALIGLRQTKLVKKIGINE